MLWPWHDSHFKKLGARKKRKGEKEKQEDREKERKKKRKKDVKRT